MNELTMLNAERVNAVFCDCVFQDGEDTKVHIQAEGITGKVGFHPRRLESHRAEIETMLDELPENFRQSGGGGWTFLNACNDRHGNQWTGLHLRMEQLFQLGIGIGKVQSCLPRELWSALPGGMPYYIIMDEATHIEPSAT